MDGLTREYDPPYNSRISRVRSRRKYEHDYNIFNPINQYRPDNPLNPINAVAPNNPFNSIIRIVFGNPANPIKHCNPDTPFQPFREVNPSQAATVSP